jgi:hypothetical protein
MLGCQQGVACNFLRGGTYYRGLYLVTWCTMGTWCNFLRGGTCCWGLYLVTWCTMGTWCNFLRVGTCCRVESRPKLVIASPSWLKLQTLQFTRYVNLPPFEFHLAELLRCVIGISMRLFLSYLELCESRLIPCDIPVVIPWPDSRRVRRL